MLIATALIAGFLLALLLVVIARRSAANELRLYAIGLVTAALIYGGLAVSGHATGRWLVLELIGIAAFGTVAWLAVRSRRFSLLAAGWAAHVLWDVLLHLGGMPGAAYTPGWYPWLCLSFDLVIAGALVRPRSGR